MKVSYEERLAIDFGLPRRCGEGNDSVLSVRVGGKRRPGIQLRNPPFRVPTLSRQGEGNIASLVYGESGADAAESETLCMCGNFNRENREIPSVSNAEPAWVHCLNGQRTARVRLT